MALSSAASALRNVVLSHLRLPACSACSAISALPTFSGIISRGFSGHFLEKDSVVERVIYVAKHFEKVDPAKVRLMPQRLPAWVCAPPDSLCTVVWSGHARGTF